MQKWHQGSKPSLTGWLWFPRQWCCSWCYPWPPDSTWKSKLETTDVWEFVNKMRGRKNRESRSFFKSASNKISLSGNVGSWKQLARFRHHRDLGHVGYGRWGCSGLALWQNRYLPHVQVHPLVSSMIQPTLPHFGWININISDFFMEMIDDRTAGHIVLGCHVVKPNQQTNPVFANINDTPVKILQSMFSLSP